MKLTDFLNGLGRPVVYYPSLAKTLGSVNAAIFVNQMLYWHGKERDPELGIYKTKAEIEDETGLSEKEQDTAVQILKAKGLLTTTYKRLEHKMFYLLHLDAINELWDGETQKEVSRTDKREVPETQKGGSGNAKGGFVYKEHEITTEITSESTHREKDTHTQRARAASQGRSITELVVPTKLDRQWSVGEVLILQACGWENTSLTTARFQQVQERGASLTERIAHCDYKSLLTGANFRAWWKRIALKATGITPQFVEEDFQDFYEYMRLYAKQKQRARAEAA